MPDLLQALHEVATGAFACSPRRFPLSSAKLKSVESLAAQVEKAFPGLPNARWVSLRLLEGDARIVDAVRSGELGRLTHERQERTEGKAHETAA
jgi:ferrous iron transport protein B